MERPLPDENSFAKINDPDFVKKIQLVELLMFPLNKRQPIHFEQIDWSLFQIWKNVCKSHLIDNESRYIYKDYQHAYDNQEPWEDEMNEVNRAYGNSLRWIKTAKNEMYVLCNVLYSSIADKEKYFKHYSVNKETIEKMKIRSRSSDAILLHKYTIELQNILFTRLIELKFPVILNKKDSVFIIERNELTGFSEGKDCTKLVCKINITDSIVHMYPIHDNETYKYKKTYDNPVDSDPLFKLDELDENTYLFGAKMNNIVKFFDDEIL